MKTQARQRLDPNPKPSAFGFGFYRHSVKQSRQILMYYRRDFLSTDRKSKLFAKLVELEQEVSEAEASAIRTFISNRGRDTLDEIRARAELFDGEVQGPRFRFKYALDKSMDEDIEDELEWLHPTAKGKECSVCLDTCAEEEFAHILTALCDHESSVCNQCVAQCIETQIPDVIGDQVRCPECPQILPYDTVKKFSSSEQFKRYDQKVFLQALGGFPNFTTCLGPNCESGQIHGSGDDQPIMTCTACNFKTCFTHKMPWHTGQTCAQYDTALAQQQNERREQEEASGKLISETAQICPNPKCGHGITKISGCDHMTCGQCGFEFCYVCRASYDLISDEGNTAHEETYEVGECHSMPDWPRWMLGGWSGEFPDRSRVREQYIPHGQYRVATRNVVDYERSAPTSESRFSMVSAKDEILYFISLQVSVVEGRKEVWTRLFPIYFHGCGQLAE